MLYKLSCQNVQWGSVRWLNWDIFIALLLCGGWGCTDPICRPDTVLLWTVLVTRIWQVECDVSPQVKTVIWIKTCVSSVHLPTLSKTLIKTRRNLKKKVLWTSPLVVKKWCVTVRAPVSSMQWGSLIWGPWYQIVIGRHPGFIGTGCGREDVGSVHPFPFCKTTLYTLDPFFSLFW